MIMKKFSLILIALLLCLALVACDGGDDEYVVITDENGEAQRVKKSETETESESQTESDTDGGLDVEIGGGDGNSDDKEWTANY